MREGEETPYIEFKGREKHKDVYVFPMVDLERATAKINSFDDYFKSIYGEFEVRKLGEGYILVSDEIIIDNRFAYVAAISSPLEEHVRVYPEIIEMSEDIN